MQYLNVWAFERLHLAPQYTRKNMSPFLGDTIIRHLEARIPRKLEKIEQLISCPKHHAGMPYDADACPCQAKEFWRLDHLDESVHKLRNRRCSICWWYIWYQVSSTKIPWFPKESIECWSQVGQPITAWQRFGVAKRNPDESTRHRRGYIYYKNSREVPTRRAAAVTTP